MAKRESKNLECENCGKIFNAFQDHGNWPRFCSRDCFCNQKNKMKKEKSCKKCGATFLSRKSRAKEVKTSDGYVDFCSISCEKTGGIYNCVNCKAEFYLTNADFKQRKGARCCSKKCKNEYYINEKSHKFKIGVYVPTETKDAFLLHRRVGHVGNYYGVHRIQAEKAIGRPLRTDERVIRLDRNVKNNSPTNLFICSSIGECTNFIHCRLPWPTESNLSYYK